MTEQNNSTSVSPTVQFGIAPVTDGHPQLTNWQPELACPFGAIDTIGQELKASAIADDIAALNFFDKCFDLCYAFDNFLFEF